MKTGLSGSRKSDKLLFTFLMIALCLLPLKFIWAKSIANTVESNAALTSPPALSSYSKISTTGFPPPLAKRIYALMKTSGYTSGGFYSIISRHHKYKNTDRNI